MSTLGYFSWQNGGTRGGNDGDFPSDISENFVSLPRVCAEGRDAAIDAFVRVFPRNSLAVDLFVDIKGSVVSDDLNCPYEKKPSKQARIFSHQFCFATSYPQ